MLMAPTPHEEKGDSHRKKRIVSKNPSAESSSLASSMHYGSFLFPVFLFFIQSMHI